MLKIFTSLTFLYAFTIVVLIVYGRWYYRSFAKSALHRNGFPIIFSLISIACFAFLWLTIHAPLQFKTFSNTDHHFIRHDGFVVNNSIGLGSSDTVNFTNNTFNSFKLAKRNKEVTVTSVYSEDPFYTGAAGEFSLLSTVFPASSHSLSFRSSGVLVTVKATSDNNFELTLNGQSFKTAKTIKKGISFWNIIREETTFINSSYYNDGDIVASLRNIFLLRNHVSKTENGELNYFLSGRLFKSAGEVAYDARKILVKDLGFTAIIPDKNIFAWGIGFFDNNKNQFRLQQAGGDSFYVLNRYPLSYPLTEEGNNDWSQHSINKFLLSDSRDMLNISPVFKEGFLFSALDKDTTADFSPVLLTYEKDEAGKPLQLKAQRLNTPSIAVDITNDRILLPAHSARFNWLFSIRNTFNWEFGSISMTANTWQILAFASLFIFFILVLMTAIVTPVEKLNWIWQLLACISVVLLTTRFLLYWRYKSFPPYEGMDLPSQQQLYSFWNFGIILLATLVLAIVFGFGFIVYGWKFLRRQLSAWLRKPYYERSNRKESWLERVDSGISQSPFIKRFGARTLFFISWLVLLASASGFAYVSHFDPGTCRHLAIGLMIGYFIYGYISYRHSPLVAPLETAWWRIDATKRLDIFISNPVKVLLAISLLTIFIFIDIGFAIVFLNFLLFNEAFLCINYAIAGLSSGSRSNARLFGFIGLIYLSAFVLNLLYAPYIFRFLLDLPQSLYSIGYFGFAILMAFNLARLFPQWTWRKKQIAGFATTVLIFAIAFFFFPKEKILDKAAMTKYRIDVLTMPVDKAIENAYREGKTYEPVIRAAQNQWFINTLIYEKNNPAVESASFHLIPHAPQNKGAKYNAQATDLVASRFLLAEHGKWSVLLYVLLLLLPTIMLASFYKLYPDFTSRVNNHYPVITAGFSMLNYFLIAALLVILAATGRYIFFGQDLPFGSILSKQSILFPSALIVITILLFKKVAQEYYANRKKIIPGSIVFILLAVLLFFVKPSFNKNKEFNADDLAKNMDALIQLRLQPVLDYFDSSAKTKKFSIAKKDKLFTDSVRKLSSLGIWGEANSLFAKETEAYTRSDFVRHLDQSRILYLDLYTGKPQLAINDNFFRIEPPPHLQQAWKGNVFADSTVYNISLWDGKNRKLINKRLNSFTNEPEINLTNELSLSFRSPGTQNAYRSLYLVYGGHSPLQIKCDGEQQLLGNNDSVKLFNPSRIVICDSVAGRETVLITMPDAFMKNFYVNGSRFYVYPMSSRFIWARNFAESIATEYTETDRENENAVVSFDRELMDSLTAKIQAMMGRDTAYKKGAEYGISIADGNGKLVAIADFIKGLARPDPNDKAGFNKTIMGDNGFVSQSLLRKQIGNINLLRLNPGPGSTFKPIVFSAIASQLNLDWDEFATEGFSQKLKYFGGERVAEYDFEKNNGRITNIIDYLKYSDNYYHSDVLLLGSYPKQDLNKLLSANFMEHNPDSSLHWPYFTYRGKQYWLDGFENWPGYINGKVNFGLDSSFTSIGLLANYGIYTHAAGKSFDMFNHLYDSLLFLNGYKKSGFILPEYGLFDQQGANVDKRIPYDVFASCFRGHVKGSSQVLVPPAKMVEAFGKLVTQSRNYSLTLDPYAPAQTFSPFAVDNTIVYNNYLSLMRESVFAGMKETLNSGTAAALGVLLKNKSPYFYYAKTGTTGDDELKTKSKLLAIVISKKDLADPGFNFRNNKFYTIYFTMQNGPAKQNEAFQNEIIQFVQRSAVFKRYMTE